MIAALFVHHRGCYVGLDGVDAWTKERDARTYAGPHRVVAHPPCERWGRFADGGFGRELGLKPGDDGGCFESALTALRTWGGVLERWARADSSGLWTCQVEQGHYGHRAPKPTWLLAYSCALPELRWGWSLAAGRITRPQDQRRRDKPGYVLITKRERWATPVQFRDLLLSIAATPGCGPVAPAQPELQLLSV